MKRLVLAAVAALALAPLVSQAQTDQPVTRASVRADLAQLEQAGYSPAARDPFYPADIQAAEARVHGDNAGAAGAYGASAEGSSVSGPAAAAANAQ